MFALYLGCGLQLTEVLHSTLPSAVLRQRKISRASSSIVLVM